MIPLGVLASARVAAGGSAAVSFIGSTSVLTTTSPQTLSGVSIGTASASRTVLCVATLDAGVSAGTRTITSLTSTGGTLTTAAATSGAAPTPILISYGAMPTGGTADFTVTASATGLTFVLSVYAIDAAVTLTDSEVDAAPTASDSMTLTSTTGGFILAAFGARSGMAGTPGASFSADYTGAAVWHGTQAADVGASTTVSITGLNLASSSGRFAAAAFA